MTKTCNINGCERPHLARGWCSMHYQRGQRTRQGAPCSIDGCKKPCRARGWCHLHYQRNSMGVSMNVPIKTPKGNPLEWIQAAALIETDECVRWPFGCRKSDGRGAIRWEGRHRFAYHVALLLAGRDVPVFPLEVRHLCGNASCVNVRHLAASTHAENIADKERHGTLPRGERVTGAKLTEVDVVAIREMDGSQRQIAERYGVHLSTIGSIKRRRTWAWLDQAVVS